MEARFQTLTVGMQRNPGASEATLARLQAQARTAVPDDYLTFLGWSNGAEGWIGPNYIAFFPAEAVAENAWAGYVYEEFLPGLWLIGGDGGEAYFAFDTRSQPMPIVVFHGDDMEFEGLVTMAPSFAAFVEFLATEDWIK